MVPGREFLQSVRLERKLQISEATFVPHEKQAPDAAAAAQHESETRRQAKRCRIDKIAIEYRRDDRLA